MGSPAYQLDGDPRTSGPGFAFTMHADRLDQPLRWRRPRAIFTNSMSDLFHEAVDPAFVGEVFRVMRDTPQHTYMVLTKRPERMRDVLAMTPLAFELPLPNVWLGVSIENSRFTWRADVLRDVPAVVRFISAEPLLGSLFQDRVETGGSRQGFPASDAQSGPEAPRAKGPLDLSDIDWVIVGGESGHGARAMRAEWARELRDACKGTYDEFRYATDPPPWGRGLDDFPGPAFFFKQWGGATPKAGGKLLDDREWCEFPVAVPVVAA